ncbi:hypothetical protein BD779DRAFT_1579982 [Infundibulicybe gibba]|nr:hypothetical protein BD779DRAFT_1579982 [Infundibulicybe gibba]
MRWKARLMHNPPHYPLNNERFRLCDTALTAGVAGVLTVVRMSKRSFPDPDFTFRILAAGKKTRRPNVRRLPPAEMPVPYFQFHHKSQPFYILLVKPASKGVSRLLLSRTHLKPLERDPTNISFTLATLGYAECVPLMLKSEAQIPSIKNPTL